MNYQNLKKSFMSLFLKWFYSVNFYLFYLFPDNRNKCRGFGYVQFVVQEDADKAVTTSKTVANRKLLICYADKKPKHEKRKKGML